MPSVKSNHNAIYVLRSCLAEEPRMIVSNIDDDISLIWERLDERFGKLSKLADAAMHKIKSLRQIQEGDDCKFLHLVDIIELQSFTWLISLRKATET